VPRIQAIPFAWNHLHAALAMEWARIPILMRRPIRIGGACHWRDATARAIVTAIPVVPGAILLKPFAIQAGVAATKAAGRSLGLQFRSVDMTRRWIEMRGPGAPGIKFLPRFLAVRVLRIASAMHGTASDLAGRLARVGVARSGF